MGLPVRTFSAHSECAKYNFIEDLSTGFCQKFTKHIDTNTLLDITQV